MTPSVGPIDVLVIAAIGRVQQGVANCKTSAVHICNLPIRLALAAVICVEGALVVWPRLVSTLGYVLLDVGVHGPLFLVASAISAVRLQGPVANCVSVPDQHKSDHSNGSRQA
jgi:hypothetical protein